ncbi:MAG: peptidylprolyl isomerase [Candidatus Lokiarchaeota archaeon]|nr:peptidylprolyl isomerase [Candidatus Lokiarchaeota archaeon]
MGKKKSKGGKMRASHILMKKHSQLLKVREKLDAGEKFQNLAKKHSECPSKKRGGDLGWFPKGAMVPEFEKAVLSLKVGDISEPVKTQFGWHLIKRTG